MDNNEPFKLKFKTFLQVTNNGESIWKIQYFTNAWISMENMFACKLKQNI